MHCIPRPVSAEVIAIPCIYCRERAGGCQAEIGAASAMAAGALVFLQGGDEVADLTWSGHGAEKSVGTGV
mgnify:CR=1 FL=1